MGDGNSPVETGTHNIPDDLPDWLRDTFDDLPRWLTENPNNNPIEEFRKRRIDKHGPEKDDEKILYDIASSMYDLIANPTSPNSEEPPNAKTENYLERIKRLRSITRPNNQPIDSQLFSDAVDIVRPFYLDQFTHQKQFKSNFFDTIIEDIRPIQKPKPKSNRKNAIQRLIESLESVPNSQAAGGTE